MRVDLRTLQPNPLRDFTIDPIDPDRVALLRQSIAEDGFWGGIVCRQVVEGPIQIAAGHHRVQAALAAGITHAEVVVREDMNDAAMVRVYARENASQRGATGTAQAGMVASAIRLLAKSILTGHLSTLVETSPKAEETLRGQLVSDKGLGEPILTQFLHGVPGMGQRIVREQLANLKASGDYARILREVQAELAREQVSREAVEAAETVAAVAAQQPRTFDLAGVAPHLRNSHQLTVFRNLVTRPGVQPYIPLTAQAELAKRVADTAQTEGREVSGNFIYERVMLEVWPRRLQAQHRRREDEWHERRESLVRKAQGAQDDLRNHLYGVAATAHVVAELARQWPQGLRFPMTLGFPDVVEQAKTALDQLMALLGRSDAPGERGARRQPGALPDR